MASLAREPLTCLALPCMVMPCIRNNPCRLTMSLEDIINSTDTSKSITLINGKYTMRLPIKELKHYSTLQNIVKEYNMATIKVDFSLDLFNKVRDWHWELNKDNIKKVVYLLTFLDADRYIYNKVCYWLPENYQELLTTDEVFMLHKYSTVVPKCWKKYSDFIPIFSDIVGVNCKELPSLYLLSVRMRHLEKGIKYVASLIIREEFDGHKSDSDEEGYKFIPRNVITKRDEYTNEEALQEIERLLRCTGSILPGYLMIMLVTIFTDPSEITAWMRRIVDSSEWDTKSNWYNAVTDAREITCGILID